MATTTTNLKLVKPEYSDTADVQVINQNMDKIDGATGGVIGSLAIVTNGNTHAAILSGQYAYVRNHASLAEGLYRATTGIPANSTLSTSNLVAVPGGLNDVCSKFESLQSAGISWDSSYMPTRSDVAMFYKKGVVCQLVFWNVSWANTISGDIGVAQIPLGYRPLEKISFFGHNGQNQICRGWLDPNGILRMSYYPGGLMYASITYLRN